MRALTSGLLHANLSPATQIAGFKVIVDFAGFTLSHVPHVSPTYLWLFAEALQVNIQILKIVELVYAFYLFFYIPASSYLSQFMWYIISFKVYVTSGHWRVIAVPIAEILLCPLRF